MDGGMEGKDGWNGRGMEWDGMECNGMEWTDRGGGDW